MIRFRNLSIAGLIFLLAVACAAQKAATRSLVVVLRDGHQKTYTTQDVSRIEFKAGAMVVTRAGHEENIPVADIVRIDFGSDPSSQLGRNHFIGRWEVGSGVGSQTFIITLNRDGEAHKTLGGTHGTWVVVGNEARISWDDGWHDAIRKVGDKHEKFAYEPGKSFEDEPSNVTDAKSMNAEPI